MNKKLTEYIILILTFLLVLFFHILNIQNKAYLSMSELFSISISNTVDSLFNKNYNEEFKGTFKGSELRQKYLIGKSNDMLRDIKTLYLYHLDPTHSNLYYSILRFSLFNLKSIDLNYLIFRGTILNILCLITAFFFLYKLLSQIYDDKIFVSFALFITFSSRGLLTNIFRVREYSLQMTLIIIFTYLLFNIYKQIKNNTFSITKKSVFLFSLISALTILSGYFTLIYIFFAYIFLAFLKKENSKEVLKYLGLNIIVTILFVFIICPHFCLAFFSAEKELFLFHHFIKSFLCIVMMCNELIFYTKPFVLYLILIIAFILALKNLYNKRKSKPTKEYNDTFIIISFIISCLYLLIIAILNPHLNEDMRRQYILMVIPFLSLIIPYLCVRFKYKKCLIFVFCIMFFISAMKMCRLARFVKSGFKFNAIKKENTIGNIINNKNKKVQILSDKNHWYEAYLIVMNFDKNREYILNTDSSDYKNTYIIVLSDSINKDNVENLKIIFKKPEDQIYIYESKD